MVCDKSVSDLAVFLVSPDKVTVSENPGKATVAVDHDGCSSPAFEHGQEGILHRGFWSDFGEVVITTHDFGDPREEIFPEAAARVKFGKVFGPEAALF